MNLKNVDFALPLNKEPLISPKDFCVLSFNSQACRWATCVFDRYKGEVTVGEIAPQLVAVCFQVMYYSMLKKEKRERKPMTTRKKNVTYCERVLFSAQAVCFQVRYSSKLFLLKTEFRVSIVRSIYGNTKYAKFCNKKGRR
jgi:hypothetical protein